MEIFIIILEEMRIMNKLNYSGKKMDNKLENVFSFFLRGWFFKIEGS